MSRSKGLLIRIGWGWLFAFQVCAFAGESVSPPQMKVPSFPLEPQKKPLKAVDPSTYVQAPDAPPILSGSGEKEAAHPATLSQDFEWAETLRVGWYYSDLISNHAFSQAGGQLNEVRRESAGPLAALLQFEARPPVNAFFPFFMAVELSGSLSQANTSASGLILPASFNSQEFQGALGLGLPFFSRSSAHDLSFGLMGGARALSVATLSSDFSQIGMDTRRIYWVQPRLRYRYFSRLNWQLNLQGAYSFALGSAGTADVHATAYRRLGLTAEALKRIAAGSSIGFGLSLDTESLTWTQSSPMPLTDPVSSTETRLSLLWVQDF